MSSTAGKVNHGNQLDLFPGLAVEATCQVRAPKRRRAHRARPPALRPVQLHIFLTDRQNPAREPIRYEGDELDEDPLVCTPVVHQWVSAAECAPAQTTGPRSVFDLGTSGLAINSFRATKEPKTLRDESHGDTFRSIGTVRHIRKDYTDTDEWREKETARRARQTTPRPKRQTFKMKNSKVWNDDQQ